MSQMFPHSRLALMTLEHNVIITIVTMIITVIIAIVSLHRRLEIFA